MNIVRYIRKQYWRNIILEGGIPLPLACDGRCKVPEKVYNLFSDEELKDIYEEKRLIRERIKKKINELN